MSYVRLRLCRTENLNEVVVRTKHKRLLARFPGRTRPEAVRMAKKFVTAMTRASERHGAKRFYLPKEA